MSVEMEYIKIKDKYKNIYRPIIVSHMILKQYWHETQMANIKYIYK